MGRSATQTALTNVVHCDMCIFVLTKLLAFTQGWIHERRGLYWIQFRSNSACQLPLRRTLAVDLSSHEPEYLRHRDKLAQLALQSLFGAL